MPAVYVVEDDQRIRELVVASLATDGHIVEAGRTAMESLDGILRMRPDLVLLDLGLPDIDGLELLRMIRAISDVPVMVATARDDERDIVALLDAGADEYVVKPYSGAEIQARVRALLRRFSQTSTGLTVGELVIDMRTREVSLSGELIELRRMEFELLAHLASKVNEVVTRDELLAAVWGQPYGGADKTIDVHVSWLRQKLGESAAEPRYIHTVRGVGFRLVEPK